MLCQNNPMRMTSPVPTHTPPEQQRTAGHAALLLLCVAALWLFMLQGRVLATGWVVLVWAAVTLVMLRGLFRRARIRRRAWRSAYLYPESPWNRRLRGGFCLFTYIATICASVLMTIVATQSVGQDFGEVDDRAKKMVERATEEAEDLIDKETLEQFRGRNADPEILEKAKALAKDSRELGRRGGEATEYDDTDSSWAFNEESFQQSGSQGRPKPEKPDPLVKDDGEVRYLMLVSLGMPDAQLKQSLIAMQGHDNVKGVVQGLVNKKATIPDTMMAPLMIRLSDHFVNAVANQRRVELV